MTRMPSCLISCSQSAPVGAHGARVGRQGRDRTCWQATRTRRPHEQGGNGGGGRQHCPRCPTLSWARYCRDPVAVLEHPAGDRGVVAQCSAEGRRCGSVRARCDLPLPSRLPCRCAAHTTPSVNTSSLRWDGEADVAQRQSIHLPVKAEGSTPSVPSSRVAVKRHSRTFHSISVGRAFIGSTGVEGEALTP